MRVSEHEAGSRQWLRDWSTYWMQDAQELASAYRKLRRIGLPEDACAPFRRMSIESLRRSLRDLKASLEVGS
jgi:hypothetical protein